MENGSKVGSSTTSAIQQNLNNLSEENFKDWYREREFSENIRKGQSYFNKPGAIKEPRRHSPSQLLQCKRKAIYKRLKAPEESEDPHGIFWIGSRIEEDLVLSYVEDCVAGDDEYVTNSIWVDFLVQTHVGKIRIKGTTDPVIVDELAEPILPFEVKTKQSLEEFHTPDRRHRAQAHAYLKGLSEKYDHRISTAIILYVSRTTLNAKSFKVEFDQEFWKGSVLPWIGDVAAFQLDQELPPAKPEYDWECEYCQYRERCGKGEREFSDYPPGEFLPLFEYPKQKVIAHLQTHVEATLTPFLADLYPDLAEEFELRDWFCRGCSSTFAFDKISWSHRSGRPPKCPCCDNEGEIRFLRGIPQNQEGAQTNDWR